jgi:hypothetical protein
MRWLLLIVPALALAASPEFQLERTPVMGGAELLTVFSNVPGKDRPVPLVAVLRDTLGDKDSSNDRLRYIWTLTAAEPTILQHAAAALPFFYFRPGPGGNGGKTPRAVIDLADTASGVWDAIAQQIVQVAAIDSNGALIRASTRRYRSNLVDRRRVHLREGLAVLSKLEAMPETRDIFSEDEMVEIQTRLSLAGQTMGGLMTAAKLPDAYYAQRTRDAETRGHNWELLRQRAEANGLYFDPLGIDGEPTHALLWIAREDTMQPKRRFEGKFLGIANPFKDSKLSEWNEVSVWRYFDADGREVDADTPGAVKRELIPLALYGLDYPKVPLLLIDFRRTHSAKRREIIAQATVDAVNGVIGYSKWGNWPYMAGSFAFNFARTRTGAATNAQLRLRSYSDVRRWLALDSTLPHDLRVDMQKRLEVMGVNPLEESAFNQMTVAQRQYDALQDYAANPDGLAARLDRDRAAELTAAQHGTSARVGFTLARIATFGLYKHRESYAGDDLILALDRVRRQQREALPPVSLPTAPVYAAGN